MAVLLWQDCSFSAHLIPPAHAGVLSMHMAVTCKVFVWLEGSGGEHFPAFSQGLECHGKCLPGNMASSDLATSFGNKHSSS